MIAIEAAKFRRLHERIDETVRTRSRSPEDRAAWEAACRAWHSYRGPLSDYILRAYLERPYTDPELVEFAVAFLEEDPWFFRSGYHKAQILYRLKRASLKESHRRRLREVLLDAARRRGTREYRHYCRLAPVVANEALVTELERVAGGADGAAACRARMMLAHITPRRRPE
jgi:hypothetical protein